MKKEFIKRIISVILALITASALIVLPVYAETESLLNVTASGGIDPESGIDDDPETVWTVPVKSKLKLDFEGMSRVSRIEVDWVIDEDDTVGFYKISSTFNGTGYQEVIDRASSFNEERAPSFEITEDGITKTTSDAFDEPIYSEGLQMEFFSVLPAGNSVGIRQVRVYGENVGDEENIAELKPVELKGGFLKSTAAVNNPNVFNDGSFSTGAYGADNNTRFGLPYGITIDLGEVCRISEIYCRMTDMQTTRNSYTYTITGSIDGEEPTFTISDDKDKKETMLHFFASKMGNNPYWSNGFYLTRCKADGAYARYITLDVTGCSYPYAYGLNEVAVIGKSDKKESVLGALDVSTRIVNKEDDTVTSISGEAVKAVCVSVQNNSGIDIDVTGAAGIYHNGYLSEVIRTDTSSFLESGAGDTLNIEINREMTEDDTICVWLEDAGGKYAPMCEKQSFGKEIITAPSELTEKKGCFEMGYYEDCFSVAVDVGQGLGGRLAAIVMKDAGGDKCIAYEVVILDDDGKAQADFKSDMESGEYPLQLLVQGTGDGYGAIEAEIEYTNTVYFKKAKDKLYNSATAADIGMALKDDFVVKNLSITDAALLYNEISTDKTNECILNYLKENPFESFADEAEFINSLSEKLEEYSLTGAAGSGTNVFEKYEDRYDELFEIKSINTYKDYFKRYDDNQKEIICKRLKGVSFEDKADFAKKLTSAILLGGIEANDSWTEIKNIINCNQDFFGVNNKNLSRINDQSEVYEKMCLKAFSGADEVRKEESRIIDDILNSSSQKGGGSGGGGGGGGGSSSKTASGFYAGGMTQAKEESKPQAQKGFSDMKGYEWAKIPAEVLLEQGIINGREENIFAPQDPVKREEIVKMLCILFNIKSEGVKSTFTDVPGGHWSYDYVAAAQSFGLVLGNGDNKFGLGSDILREDAASMCYRFAAAFGVEPEGEDTEESVTKFIDDGDISDYAYDSVYRLAQAGIISGNGEGEFAPKNTLTRAEAAVIIYNTFIFIKKSGGEIR